MNDVIQALVNIGSQKTGQVVVALSLTGILTMAILQTLKDLTPVRRAFQRAWLGSWLAQRVARLSGVNLDEAKRKLIELATGGETDAFYDLAAEQLVAQMNAAAQIALDYPGKDHYYAVLAVLAEGADAKDVAAVAEVSSARSATSPSALPPGYADARTRVSHRIQRNLDGLQIAMGNRWQFFLQLASIILSTIVIEIAIFTQSNAQGGVTPFFLGILVGIIGGYLAPVTRDLVAALQNLRKP